MVKFYVDYGGSKKTIFRGEPASRSLWSGYEFVPLFSPLLFIEQRTKHGYMQRDFSHGKYTAFDENIDDSLPTLPGPSLNRSRISGFPSTFAIKLKDFLGLGSVIHSDSATLDYFDSF